MAKKNESMISTAHKKVLMRMFFVPALIASAMTMSGCLILYMPHVYHIAETTSIAGPFKNVLVELNPNASENPLMISLESSGSMSSLHVRFFSASMKDEDGKFTKLVLTRQFLENPKSFLMEFKKADYLGHDLTFEIIVMSEGRALITTFHSRFTTKVYWPKDSDYSG